MAILIRRGIIPPVATGPVNLLTKTEDISDAVWTRLNIVEVNNQTTDPLGGSTADKVQGTASGADLSYFWQRPTGAAANTWTASIYGKVNTGQWMALCIFDEGNTTFYHAWFDLLNGVKGTKDAGISTSNITTIGSGWYRLDCTRTTVGSCLLLVEPSVSGDGSGSGAATDNFYWGAQMEIGSSPTAYEAHN